MVSDDSVELEARTPRGRGPEGKEGVSLPGLEQRRGEEGAGTPTAGTAAPRPMRPKQGEDSVSMGSLRQQTRITEKRSPRKWWRALFFNESRAL